MAEGALAAPAQSYPLTFDVEYPEELSRWLIFVKGILVIPHLIVLYGLGLVASALTFIAFFGILFTKRYPRELFDFVVNINRWIANVTTYIFLMRDEYPPFSWDAGEYPVSYDVEYPEELSRWLIFVKWILAIPHIIVLAFLFTGAFLALFGAWFAILFTKRYPESLFNYMVGVLRWQLRVNAYTNLLRDEYPPFSLEA
ncbi:MAG: DUF4389 domain-containing protein [Chloroflexi bacterium]|nr:DUF4389 domain-containing protein [Chloroflexota bacterium]MCH8008214.1 DUF4389 domain-containing protein [Chloroflexota bacterium]